MNDISNNASRKMMPRQPSAWEDALKNVAEALDAFASASKALQREHSWNRCPMSAAVLEAIYSTVATEYTGLGELEKKVWAARNRVLSPLSRLPDECISSIFILCSEGELNGVSFNAADDADSDYIDDGTSDATSSEDDGVEDDEYEDEDSAEYSEYEDGDGSDAQHEDEHESDDDDDDDDGGGDSEDSRGDTDSSSGRVVEVTSRYSNSFRYIASRVCRRWRDVARTTPQLWMHIDLTEKPPFQCMDLRLERSRNVPLDVVLDTASTGVDGVALAINLLLALDRLKSSIFQNDAPRCINLTINTRFHSTMRLVLRELTHVSQNLRLRILKLAVRSLLISPSDGPDWRFSTMSNLLKDVGVLHLREYRFPWDHPIYTKLTELCLSGIRSDNRPTRDQLHAVLRSCPALEYLALNDIDLAADPDPNPESPPDHQSRSPLPLQHLRTIKLSHLDFDVFAFFFSIITAPRLSQLGIHSMRRGSLDVPAPEFARVLLDSFAISNDTISHLAISDVEGATPPSSIINLLRTIRHLVWLELHHVDGLPNILHDLSHGDTYPELRSLSLTNCDHEPELTSIALLSLVTNRKFTHPIHDLAVRGCHLEEGVVVSLLERIPRFIFAEV
ncbi:hypothetical protein BOTBODRAFT_179960 [Botryobasidium botryosum FD-172 SS1]|uniref:Uncharacterized protein n=1 Tax=Botryobasidium botryosum (strain FD-172 SS1) TaxID=930990 RepID=A0A067M0Z8_BOTB1|nr:hypothetical protein BOTBODRAFT_179960 [Botryobasidium botryosum FD-172 SS1]